MKLEEAQRLTKQFGSGVAAEIWCYAGEGNWAITIELSDSKVSFYTADDLRRTVAKLKLALDHVQSVSMEDGWQDCPADPFTSIVGRSLPTKGES